MASVNKVFLIGNLTQDPELRYTPNGAAVTDLRLAVNRIYNTKEGERREETLFIDVTVWNRQAENCCQYLRKGRPVHVEGFLKMDSWDDRTTGEKRTKIKVEADRVQFLDSRRDDAGGGGTPAHDDEYAPPAAREPRRGPAPAGPDHRGGGGNGPSRPYNAPTTPAPSRRPAPPPEEAEDDIPF